MRISAHIGSAQGPYGNDVAAHAARRALDQVGNRPIGFGMIIASHYHPHQSILQGVSSLLGEIPLLGFSSTTEIIPSGLGHHAVVVILITGDNFSVKADFWPGLKNNTTNVVKQISDTLQLTTTKGTLLITTDGFSEDANVLCANLPAGDYYIAGGLSGGNPITGSTYQIGGHQAGMGGVAAALLTGQLSVATSQACGWKPVGKYIKITGSSGRQIYSIENERAIEAYAGYFRHPASDWISSPLNQLIRLYPLGIELSGPTTLAIRSPILVESDGSLLMDRSIPEGSIAHLLIGSQETCLKSAREAASQAQAALGSSHPFLGIVLIDVAWQMMFASKPGLEINALREVLGPDIPLVGGYSYGQIRGASGSIPRAELYNQQLQLILFAD